MEDSEPSLSRQRRRSDLDHAENSTTTIPFDIIIEVLSLLPAKSLIRFQSVSKLWLSTIRSKNLADSFLTRSKTRPRLLIPFMHVESDKLFILSATEHNNKEDEKSSSIVIPRHDMTIDDPFYYIGSRPVNGLVCCIHDSFIVVCNPTTRQIVKLPDIPPKELWNRMYAHLGYDPVEDQYKVLCVMMVYNPLDQQDIQQEHYVCTVRSSSQKQEWRRIENTTGENYHSSTLYKGICIDGAIYYGVEKSRIVRFDVRSEKMEFIKAPKESNFSTTFLSTLINYKGKLGGVDYYYSNKKEDMRLWILEDAEKQEWSSMTCVLPSELECLLGTYVMSKEEIHTGELMVFHPRYWSSKPFGVWYYDFKKQSIIRKVEIMLDGDFRRIHGTDEITDHRSTYPGYFENIRFL